MTTPQEKGRQWEKEVAEIVGGTPVKGSGGGLYKLDVGGRSLLWSNKHTAKQSFRVDRATVQEMRDATTGIGGLGGDVTPILVVRFAQAELVAVVGFVDLVSLLKEDARLIPETKDELRRKAASLPTALRDE